MNAADIAEIRAAVAATEIPTTEKWRKEMRLTRKRMGLTQTDLAELIGCSQATISEVEAGVLLSSTVVPAIAVALRMRSPHVEVEPEEQRWLDVGRVLRHRKPEVFARWLDALEADVEELRKKKEQEK